MTWGSLTSYGARAVLIALTLAGCGDDAEEPPSSSLLAAIDAALCDHPPADELPDIAHFDPEEDSYVLEDGTVFLVMGGELYDMSDC